MWRTQGKFILELLGALVMAGIVTYQQVAVEGVTASEWVMVVIALAGAANVWSTANITHFNKAKTIVSALFVVLNLLVGMLTDGHLTGDEMLLLAVQALSTLGVAGAPATRQVVERTVVSS